MIFAVEITPGWIALALTILVPSAIGFHRALKKYYLYQSRVEILWKRSKIEAADEKHSPDPKHARTDYLLERSAADTLTRDEARELIAWLQKVIKSESGFEKEKTSNFIEMLRLDYDLK